MGRTFSTLITRSSSEFLALRLMCDLHKLTTLGRSSVFSLRNSVTCKINIEESVCEREQHQQNESFYIIRE